MVEMGLKHTLFDSIISAEPKYFGSLIALPFNYARG